MKSKFKIEGLDCANCASTLERVIKKVDGVINISINFMMERMEVEYEDDKKEEVLKNIKKIIKKEEPEVQLTEL